KWVAERLRDQQEERSIVILNAWMHYKSGKEATRETIKELNTLSLHDAKLAILELHTPKKYIQGTQGNQMNITCKLTTLDTQRSMMIQALLDSGCTGSCIDYKFVKKQEYQTHNILRPIPVYNANGTLNKDGAIKEFVELKMEIDDHSERIHFAVTNLGNGRM
ncbi:hypothetical protein SERLA73DRAFT_38569, partial [Serpula lacrymans var. lacrymans S7.3]